MGPIEFFSQQIWQRWAFSLMYFLWQGAAIAFLLVVLVKMLNIQGINPVFHSPLRDAVDGCLSGRDVFCD
jgi:hypothetical protein